MTQANPLQQYYRTEKIYIGLPSGTTYYSPDAVIFTDNGEVGVMPMTAKDEMITKNPDALLNGEAIAQLISSCVPAVKNPKNLLNNDIEALLIAIRHATYGDNLEISTNCPVCKAKNNFEVNITQSLSTMGKLEDEYKLEMENGIVVFVKPFSYAETIKALRAQFVQVKVARNLDNDALSDDQRLSIYSKSYTEISNLNIELLLNCIVKVVTKEGTEVIDKKFILEFLNNVDRKTVSGLDELVKEINNIGVNKSFIATCSECSHKWDSVIEFNPISFFTES